jgi:hypothetical protein
MNRMPGCLAIPIDDIRAASAFCSTLSASPVGRGYRRFTILYALPKVTNFIVQSLSNDAIAKLTHEEAAELYVPLLAVSRELDVLVSQVEGQNFLFRMILKSWIKTMRARADRLSDIAEALAWSADPNLRVRLDAAVNSIEQRQLHLA